MRFLLADFGREVSPITYRLREKDILVRQRADFHGIDDGDHLRLAVKDAAANARMIDALWAVGGAVLALERWAHRSIAPRGSF